MFEEELHEKLFIRELFERLNNSSLKYCVLRNYDTLPDSMGGSDLDLAVLADEKDEVAILVMQVAEMYGGKAIVDYTSSGRFIRILGCHQGGWWGAAVDLFWMMEYRGVEYIPSKNVIFRAREYRGVKVARDDDAAAIALVKELLSNGKTRKTYLPDLAKEYESGGRDSLKILDETFSNQTLEMLVQQLVEGENDAQKILQLSKQLRKDVLRGNLNKKAEGMVVNLISRIRRLFKPAGASVAIIGTDGSGKSTLINEIRPVLERSIHNTLQYEHLRPNWLPALGVATGKRPPGDGSPETNPHGQKPSGFLGSLLRLAYYAIDYTLGYWMNVYPYMVKRPHICLFDRYCYDFMIDPTRMRIRLPQWIIKTAVFLMPRPNIIICLGADPSVLYQRKPETSLEEVERQVRVLKKFSLQHTRAFWVDTATPVERSVHEILHLIRGALVARYR